MSSKEKMITITMLFDLVAAKDAPKNIPENIKSIYPEIVTGMSNAYKGQNRFYGFVVVTGEKPESFSACAKNLSSVDVMVRDLCEYASKFGARSQWIVVSDKQTKKALKSIINKISVNFSPIDGAEAIAGESVKNDVKGGV